MQYLLGEPLSVARTLCASRRRTSKRRLLRGGLERRSIGGVWRIGRAAALSAGAAGGDGCAVSGAGRCSDACRRWGHGVGGHGVSSCISRTGGGCQDGLHLHRRPLAGSGAVGDRRIGDRRIGAATERRGSHCTRGIGRGIGLRGCQTPTGLNGERSGAQRARGLRRRRTSGGRCAGTAMRRSTTGAPSASQHRVRFASCLMSTCSSTHYSSRMTHHP